MIIIMPGSFKTAGQALIFHDHFFSSWFCIFLVVFKTNILIFCDVLFDEMYTQLKLIEVF